MSFQKLNLCESTQVAFNVFHMFRSNTVNMMETPTPDGTDTFMSQYEPDYVLDLEDNEVQPYDNRKLNIISTILTEGSTTQIRIHDIKEYGEQWRRSYRRLVQFYVTPSFSLGQKKVIFSIVVGQDYLDGDEVSGMTAWKMIEAEMKSIGYDGDRPDLSFRMKPSTFTSRQWDEFSSQMRKDIGGVVHFVK